jgi:hypothetical protein
MIHEMRWSAVGSLALLAACAQETSPAPHVGTRPAPPPESDAAITAELPPQYVVGDPARANTLTVVPVGDDSMGVVLEGVRFVLRGPTVRTSRDVADVPLQSAWRVPARMGGGFLFRARAALYATESFEGLLRPVVALPADVADVSFAPRAALVRSEAGERWMIEPASGKRVPITPAGLLEIAALDDGRALALVEGGQLLVSTDAGDHWADATASLRAPPKRVFVSRATATQKESLWVETQGSTPVGLLPGGRLAAYDTLPTVEPAPTLRAKQPAWREEEPPLRRAMRSGAPSRDGSALVVASGDLVQVDVVSGAVEIVAAGKLPPDATCVATRTQDDVVFTCARGNGGAFVVAHGLDRAPIVEQTFTDAGRFIVSDDGTTSMRRATPAPVPPTTSFGGSLARTGERSRSSGTSAERRTPGGCSTGGPARFTRGRPTRSRPRSAPRSRTTRERAPRWWTQRVSPIAAGR